MFVLLRGLSPVLDKLYDNLRRSTHNLACWIPVQRHNSSLNLFFQFIFVFCHFTYASTSWLRMSTAVLGPQESMKSGYGP